MDDKQPRQVGIFDLTYGMPPDELAELDQGRYLCSRCGEYFAPDGTDGHTECLAAHAIS